MRSTSSTWAAPRSLGCARSRSSTSRSPRRAIVWRKSGGTRWLRSATTIRATIGIPDHRIYGRDPGLRRFLVHVVDAGGERWTQFIRFRDLLRGDPRLASAYEAAKLEAAAKHPTGPRSSYTDAKAGFIERVLADTRGS